MKIPEPLPHDYEIDVEMWYKEVSHWSFGPYALVQSLIRLLVAERIAAQSELLSRMAEKSLTKIEG